MKKTNEFVLPEKWCVKHYPETLEWIRNNAEHNGTSINKSSYYYFPCDDSYSNYSHCFPFGGYSEITFEQFKEHVLKDIPSPEYDPKDVAFKPVGYNFKDDKIRNIVTAFLGDIKAYKTDSYDFPVKSSVYRELKELHVLDLWCDKVMFEKESEFNSKSIKIVPVSELEVINPKKIIGYKLIKPEYKEVAEIIAFSHMPTLVDKSFINFPEGFNFYHTSYCKENLENAGVLNLWFEEVYEKETITLKSGVTLSEDDIAEVKEILNNK